MTSGAVTAVAFGVGMELRWSGLTDPDRALADVLPPLSSVGGAGGAATIRVRLTRVRRDWWVHLDDAAPQHPAPTDATFATLSDALAAINHALAMHVGLSAPGLVFFHAGVVSYDRCALLLPGRSYSGKSTLVAALLRRGCDYLSDEYAVIDQAGLVRAYPRALRLRTRHGHGTRRASELGSATVLGPLPVRLIAGLTYTPHRAWDVRHVAPRESAMALIDNALAARTRPSEVLKAASSAASGARAVHGVRGDAEVAAGSLMRMLSDME